MVCSLSRRHSHAKVWQICASAAAGAACYTSRDCVAGRRATPDACDSLGIETARNLSRVSTKNVAMRSGRDDGGAKM